jgi:hypothetical protein
MYPKGIIIRESNKATPLKIKLVTFVHNTITKVTHLIAVFWSECCELVIDKARNEQ